MEWLAIAIVAIMIFSGYLIESLGVPKCPKCKSREFEKGKWPHFISDVIIDGHYDNRKCKKCGKTWIEYAESGVEVSLGG